jgi:hypothetical protein
MAAAEVMRYWTVSIETWGDPGSVSDDQLFDLGPLMAELGGDGAAVGPRGA